MTTEEKDILELYKAIGEEPKFCGGPIEGPLAEHTVIPIWKLKRIHEAIRLSKNYRQEVRTKQKLPETCLDRTIEEAWNYSSSILKETERESRNAKIRNRLTPFANAIALIEEMKQSNGDEYKALLVSLLIDQKDALSNSLDELKKLI